ncbi:hypothetical protein ILYODFUR_025475 [Ilyodon furcidens]|uniref:Uncharacterized protein n=1 Tax=Ilyodon furcidens TaxID=33524 RepID=A0ABV0VIL6_9TELE
MSHFPSCYGATGTYLFQDTYLYTHTYTCAYQLMPVQNGVFVHLSPPLSSQPGRCVEGCSRSTELGAFLLGAIRSLYKWIRRLVPIAGTKLDVFPVLDCWTPAGRPFVTGPIHYFYGQDF